MDLVHFDYEKVVGLGVPDIKSPNSQPTTHYFGVRTTEGRRCNNLAIEGSYIFLSGS